MRVYADSSALRRAVLETPESAAWRAWYRDNRDNVVTSQPAIAELRAAVAGASRLAQVVVADLIPTLRVIRVSDQALKRASMTQGVLAPFDALHFGIAKAEPDVDVLATYHRELAAVAHLHGLSVISPGRTDQWWT